MVHRARGQKRGCVGGSAQRCRVSRNGASRTRSKREKEGRRRQVFGLRNFFFRRPSFSPSLAWRRAPFRITKAIRPLSLLRMAYRPIFCINTLPFGHPFLDHPALRAPLQRRGMKGNFRDRTCRAEKGIDFKSKIRQTIITSCVPKCFK